MLLYYSCCTFYLDINECTDHCQVHNVTCENTIGSYKCVCPEGFSFNYTFQQCQGYELKTIFLSCNNLIICFMHNF